MFTGLIEATGKIVDRQTTPGGVRLHVETALAPELRAGDSIAVNGVCLTVVDTGQYQIWADLGPETLRVTTFGRVVVGTTVNLERPLRADGRLGGHFVQGHVDEIGEILARRPEAEFEWFTIGFPGGLAPYLVPKGSIAVDGISLTVATLAADRFDVQIVPFTLEKTNLRFARVGDPVNLECDVVGKYVVRIAEVAGWGNLIASGEKVSRS
jgi:riboflavin synthase